MKVQYTQDVTSPRDRLGTIGQTREDLPDHAVEDLVRDGYVEIIEPADAEKGATPDGSKEGTPANRGSKRSQKSI